MSASVAEALIMRYESLLPERGLKQASHIDLLVITVLRLLSDPCEKISTTVATIIES